MYDNISKLFKGAQVIDWNEPFNVYCIKEEPKWIKQHGMQVWISHKDSTEKKLKRLFWYKRAFIISEMFEVELSTDLGWVKRLCCSNHLCSNFQDKNVKCKGCNFWGRQNPITVKHASEGFWNNSDTKEARSINKIHDYFIKNNFSDLTAIIIEEGNMKLLMDGHHTLITMAAYEDCSDKFITVYLGTNLREI